MESTLYWITRLDSIKSLLFLLSFITGFGSILVWILYAEDLAKTKTVKAISLSLITTCSIIAVVYAFIPTTSEMIVIKGVPRLMESKLVKEDLPRESKELYQLAKDYLKNKVESSK